MEPIELNNLILQATQTGVIKQREPSGTYYFMSNKLGDSLEEVTNKLNEKPALLDLIKGKLESQSNSNTAQVPGAAGKTDKPGAAPSVSEKLYNADEVKDIVDRMLSDYGITKIKKEARPGTEKHILEQGSEIYDPEDELETPVVFYSYRSSFIITGTRKNHKEMPNPIGHYDEDNNWIAEPVEFKQIDKYNNGRSGKELKIVRLCAYACYSKKQLKWLKSIPQYGVYFFEKKRELSKVDYAVEMSRVDAYNQVERMGVQQILAYYQNLNLGLPTDDINEIKLKVIEHKAKQIADSKEASNKRFALETLERAESYGSSAVGKQAVA